MLRRWLVGGLSVALLASALLAKPGVVTNRQGETFKGDVSEDDKFVYINGAGGQIKLDKRNISSVAYDEQIDDQYKARHAKLAANDVKGRIDLAQWANENQRADLAVAALTEARKLDPFNKDAARALDAAQQQLDLDKAGKNKSTASPTPAPAPAATGPTTQGAAVAQVVPLERRLLNNDEINIIRQKEMQPDDPKVRIRFENNVLKKYLASGDHDAAEFNKLAPQAQAMEILSHGDPKMAKDVHILTDPTPLLEFRQKVHPIIATGCASIACHGGNKGGDFSLYTGESVNAVYTNFYILFSYSTTMDGVKYMAMDRDVPERSLLLQFGLPRADGKPPHPKVLNLKPRFKSIDDPAYSEVFNWMSKSITVLQPNYGIAVSPRLPGPATQPAVPMTTASPTTPAPMAPAPMAPAPMTPAPAVPGRAPDPIKPIPTPNPDPSPKVAPNK